MKAKVLAVTIRLFLGILSSSIAIVIGYLLYDHVHSFIESRQKILAYEYYAKKETWKYGNIEGGDFITYTIYVENVGHGLISQTAVHLYFPYKDARVVMAYPFEVTYKHKERHLPPRAIPATPPNFPYIKELNKLFGHPLWLFKYPETLKIIEQSNTYEEAMEKIYILILHKLSQIYYDTLPPKAYEIYEQIGPLEPRDRGKFVLSVVVKNIAVFQEKPPIFCMESKSPEIKIITRRRNHLVEFCRDHIKLTIFLLALSIGFNILLYVIILRRKKVIGAQINGR